MFRFMPKRWGDMEYCRIHVVAGDPGSHDTEIFEKNKVSGCLFLAEFMVTFSTF
jgi:hypothetical protein